VPQEARLHFPGGLGDYLTATLADRPLLTPRPFIGQADFPPGGNGAEDSAGSVEWAVVWAEDEEDGFCHSYCNTIPTQEGGTHETGLRNAILRGIRAYAELTGSRRVRSSARSTMRSSSSRLVAGSAPSQWSKWSRTAFSTSRAASAEASRSLV
jgi:topoisomerase-4 subunit B